MQFGKTIAYDMKVPIFFKNIVNPLNLANVVRTFDFAKCVKLNTHYPQNGKYFVVAKCNIRKIVRNWQNKLPARLNCMYQYFSTVS